MFSNGKWKRWYFYEQLKYAKANGYKIKVIKGYSFNREKDVFTSFIHKLYYLKSNSKTLAERYLYIYILLLNSLLGRFGLDINKPVSKLVDKDTLRKLDHATNFTSPPKRIQVSMLLSYKPEIDRNKCDTLKIDVIKVRNLLDIELK